MADPAWGTASSLSDEETARALCAFQHTEPQPTQRRQPLQEMPQLAPGAHGLAAFGYPSNAAYHLVPMSARRDEAASVLVRMNAPSTASDDWQQQQQRSIQEQIEREQRELQTQERRQQQRAMEVQLHQMQQQQAQAQRQVEMIQQPRYASGADGFEQTTWANGVHTPHAASSFSGSVDNAGQGSAVQRGRQMQRSAQFYDGGPQRGQQMTGRHTATAPDFVSSHRETSQTGVPVSAGDRRLAGRQVPQPVQSHFQARSPESFATSSLQSWGRQDPISCTGMQANRTKLFQQTAQRFMLQTQQPQPHYPTGAGERSRQENTTLSQASSSRPDDDFLNGIMRHFSSSAGPVAGVPTTGTPTIPNDGYAEAGSNNFRFNQVQTHVQAPAAMRMQLHKQMEAQSRTPVPPTGITVVPGVSLASPPIRLVTMRDLLNGDDGSSKVETTKNRARGGKKQRTPSKRKAPKKKGQRMPQQQNERGFQRPTNRAGTLLLSQSLAPIGVSAPAAKPCTPMYLAFMESRAARALEQTAGISSARTSITISHQQPPAHAPQSYTDSAKQKDDRGVDFVARPIKRRRGPYKKKKLGTPLDAHNPADLKLPAALLHAATNAGASLDKQTPRFVQSHDMESVRSVAGRHTLLNDRLHSEGAADFPLDGGFEQYWQQQQKPQPPVPTNTSLGGQPFLKLELIENGKLGASSKKRRKPKLPRAGSNQPAVLQREPGELLVSRTLTGSSATNTAMSSAVAHALAVSDPPRVENRTVVIFCKRDFMRYQTAKIWRKYQDQLKKQEEWREVRVAGKRTRYLNSRYDDEIRKTHRKPYTRSGRSRRTSAQKTEGSCSHKMTSPTAGPVITRSTSSSPSALPNGGAHESNFPAREPHQTADAESADSRASSSADDAHSSTEKCSAADDASLVALQELPSRTEDETKRVELPRGSSEPMDGVVSVSTIGKAHPALNSAALGEKFASIVGIASGGDFITGASSSGNSEITGEVSEDNPAVTDAAPEGINTFIGRVQSRVSAEVTSLEPKSSIGAAFTETPNGTVADVVPSNGSVEVISSILDNTPSTGTTETSSFDTTVADTASDITIETAASGTAEEHPRDETNRHPGENEIAPASILTSTKDEHSCPNSVQDDTPPDQ